MAASAGSIGELFSGVRGRVLIFCWFGWVLDLYDLLLLSFLRPELQADLGIEPGSFGTILGVQLAATAVGGVTLGRLADRRGRGLGLSWSIALFSVGTFWTGVSSGFQELLLARALTGFGVGGEWGIGHALVAETFPGRLRGRAAGILQAASPVGVALASLVAALAAEGVGWRNCFLLSAIPGVSVLFLRRILGASLTQPETGPGSEPRPSGEWRRLLRPPLAPRTAVLLAVLTLHMATFWSVYTWLPGELRKLHSPGSVAVLQLWISGVHIGADVLFGMLSDRFGRRRVFLWFTVSFAVGLALVALVFDRLVGDLFVFGLVFVPLGLGMGTWSCFGVLFAELFPRELRATAGSGLYNLARGIQGIAQPLVGSSIARTGSLATALWFGAATTLGSALLLGFALRAVLPSQSEPDRKIRPESQ